jgi:hypothetical protein
MNEKKQTSSNALMGLIVLMFVLQTIHSACLWYLTWLGVVYYGESTSDTLEGDELTSLSLLAINSMSDLLTTLRLAIADSIMVSTCLSLPANTNNRIRCEGLEVLDHMQ